MYGAAFTPYIKQHLERRGYRRVFSPEIFSVEYIDHMVNRYLEGIEIRGAELNELTALALFSLTGWYGDN